MRLKKGDMMAFLRVFISLFLLLISNLSFAVDFKYYDDANGTCSTVIQPLCDARLATENKNSTNSTYPNTYSLVTCQTIAPQYQSKRQIGVSGGVPVYSTSGVNYIANKVIKTCATGDVLKLTGCTATCVPDPCKVRIGTSDFATVECGNLSCSAGVTSVNGSGFTCTSITTAVKNSCLMTLPASAPPPSLSETLAKPEQLGSSSIKMYCPRSFEYTGASSPSSDTSETASAAFVPSYMTPDADGNCPAGFPTRGQVNNVDVCAADSLTGARTGENGSSCPTGYIEGANGTCTTDPNYGTGGTGTGTGTGETGGTCTSTTCSANTTAECKTAPDCTGDAINCAILLQSWKNACLLVAPPTTQERQDITTATTETDSAINGIKSDLQGSLDAAMSTLPANIPTSTACLANPSFTLLGKSIPIPLSKLCPYFQTMRAMLLLLSYLFAARIIFGSIGGGGGVRV